MIPYALLLAFALAPGGARAQDRERHDHDHDHVHVRIDPTFTPAEENGYTWDGPPIEMYTRKPKVVDGKAVFHAKIMAPVRKK